jgi:protein TonB
MRITVSAVLGVLTTFTLVMLMYKLIDSGKKELDDTEVFKIPDILHIDRDITENSKRTEVEKPDEPEQMPDIPEQQLQFEAPENVVNMALPAIEGGLKIGNSGFARDSDYIPVYVPQPQYPRRAQTRGKEGYAVVEVIITTTGGVRDPVMVEEWPQGWGFGRAALKTANKLKYNPRVIDGVPQEVPGVLYKFTFRMAK